jgi:hypothetical protein
MPFVKYLFGFFYPPEAARKISFLASSSKSILVSNSTMAQNPFFWAGEHQPYILHDRLFIPIRFIFKHRKRQNVRSQRNLWHFFVLGGF